MMRSLLLLLALSGTLLAFDGEPDTKSGEIVFRDPVIWFKTVDREIELGTADGQYDTLGKHGLSASNYQQNTTEGETGTKDISAVTISGANGFTLTLTNKQHVPVTRTTTYKNGQPVYTWALAQASQ